MLKTRVITAIVMLALLLPALFYPAPWPFCALVLLLIAGGAWEWGRLNGLGQTGSVALGLFCVLLCACAWAAGLPGRPLPVVWIVSGGLWVLVGAGLLQAGVAGWSRIPRALRLVGGLIALCMAWLAVARARTLGINFLLSVLLLVWIADIAAYFAGRRFGTRLVKRKLAPSISPGKSWEGVFGGMLGVLLMAIVWVWADAHFQASVGSLYTRLAALGWALAGLALLFLTAMSVVGDLVESLIKRSAGVKDSSGLLPGHGGVLDRVDALLPALPLALMFSVL